jgi:hypothetical protein
MPKRPRKVLPKREVFIFIKLVLTLSTANAAIIRQNTAIRVA